jgi:hypothetical protein
MSIRRNDWFGVCDPFDSTRPIFRRQSQVSGTSGAMPAETSLKIGTSANRHALKGRIVVTDAVTTVASR